MRASYGLVLPAASPVPLVRQVAAKVIVICYGCAGSRTDPKGGPCKRCNGTGVDPNP